MKKFLREPLVRFLLLGAAIFVASSFVSRGRTDKPGEIVITQARIETLVTGFTRTWRRPPTEQELDGLVKDYAREEAAYREAMAQGLDRDDTIIRRRLRQKLEFLSEDLTAKLQPTAAELEEYLRTHPQDFQVEPTVTFQQIYLDPQKHGTHLARDAATLLASLRRAGTNVDMNTIGDPFLLEARFDNVTLSDVTKMFGSEFATNLSKLPSGEWTGPVKSGYGEHLVFVAERTEAHLRPLSEVQAQVTRDWMSAKRQEAMENYYASLLRHYKIKIEPAPEKKLTEVR
jgi:hypothetical protein